MFGTRGIESDEQSATGPRIFFSTSNYAEVPDDAWDLLLPLIQQLAQNWAKTIQSAETYLLTKVRRRRGTSECAVYADTFGKTA